MPGVDDASNSPRLEGERIFLRPVNMEDVTEEYVAWMRDPEVNRFMETRFRYHSPEGIADFVRGMRADPNISFFAIVLKDEDRHIGNVKLAVRPEHARGEISLFIGDKGQWGRGLATEAVSLIKKYGLETIGLAKLTAGCYANNLGSVRAFENNGFERDALLCAEYVCEGRRVDGIRFACFAKDQI